MKLKRQKIDVSLRTFVDDLMDIFDRRYSRCHEVTRCDKRQKNSHKNLKKSDVSWNQAKRRGSSSGWGLTPERTWPNVAQELCWIQVASSKQSGISDVETLFGVFGFATQGDRGEKRSLAHSGRGRNSRGGRGAGSKSLPKPKSGEGQTPSNGSREE